MTTASASPAGASPVTDGARRWAFAAAGALVLGLLVVNAPRIGKPLLVLVVFSMLAAWVTPQHMGGLGGKFPTR